MARLSSGIAQEGETVAHDEGDADLQRAILWSMLSTAGTVKLPQASASQMSLALEVGHRNNTAYASSSYQRPAAFATTALHAGVIFT